MNDEVTPDSASPEEPASDTPETEGASASTETEQDTQDAPTESEDDAHDSAPLEPAQVRLETTEGEIVIELLTDIAPRHAENFAQLVHEGFFDGQDFHRVLPGYLIQSGCPNGDGTGGPGWAIDAEFSDTPFEKGMVCMARRANDINSAGSQFFICLDRKHFLDIEGQYTVFGKVIEGLDTVDLIAETMLEDAEIGRPHHAPQIVHGYETWFENAHHHDHHDEGEDDAPESEDADSTVDPDPASATSADTTTDTS
jgi:peptidylprolyl isomerase